MPVKRKLIWIVSALFFSWLSSSVLAEAEPEQPHKTAGFALELHDLERTKNGSLWTVSVRPRIVNRGTQAAHAAVLSVVVERATAVEHQELELGAVGAGSSKNAAATVSYSFDVEQEEPPTLLWKLRYRDDNGASYQQTLKP